MSHIRQSCTGTPEISKVGEGCFWHNLGEPFLCSFPFVFFGVVFSVTLFAMRKTRSVSTTLSTGGRDLATRIENISQMRVFPARATRSDGTEDVATSVAHWLSWKSFPTVRVTDL